MGKLPLKQTKTLVSGSTSNYRALLAGGPLHKSCLCNQPADIDQALVYKRASSITVGTVGTAGTYSQIT